MHRPPQRVGYIRICYRWKRVGQCLPIVLIVPKLIAHGPTPITRLAFKRKQSLIVHTLGHWREVDADEAIPPHLVMFAVTACHVGCLAYVLPAIVAVQHVDATPILARWDQLG